MNYRKILQNNGFKKAEADIYLSFLRLGLAKVSDIAKEVSIPRTSIYGYIKSLTQNGYLKKTKKKGVEYFSPIKPSIILQEKQDYLKNLSTAIPQLEKILTLAKPEPKIEYFDTIRGQLNLYEKILKINPKKTFFFIESGKTLKYLMEKMGFDFWLKWQKKFLNKKLIAQGISTIDYIPQLKSLPENFKKVFSQRSVIVRMVDEREFPFAVNIYFFPPNLIFLQIPQENFVISIENKNIYNFLFLFYQLLSEKGKIFDLKNI